MSEVTEARNSSSMFTDKIVQRASSEILSHSLLHCGTDRNHESAPNKTESDEKLPNNVNSARNEKNWPDNQALNIEST